MLLSVRTVLMSVFATLATFLLRAQSVPHFLHHPLGHPLHNPAVIMGETRAATLQLLHRSQWVGYRSTYDSPNSSPTTQQLQLLLPFERSRTGLGLTFTQDAVGPLLQQFLQLAVGYSVRLHKRSTLSFGLSPLYRRQSIDRSSYRAIEKNDPLLFEETSPQSLDFSTGIMYTYEGLQAGVSALQIRALGLTSLGREYAFFSAYNFSLYNPRLRGSSPLWIRPGLMIRSGYDLQMDVSLLLYYNNRLRGGVLWRNQESVALLLGLDLLKQGTLSVGYGFELITTEAKAKQSTSHEAMLRYTLQISSTTSKRPVYTPRFPF